jgi:hypothetical protein
MPRQETISDLQLEQYSLGELSADQAGRVREELEGDPQLRSRLSAMAASDREILADYPPERIVPVIRERLLREGAGASQASRRARTLAWAVPVAAMVLALVTFFVVREQLFPNETRLKGSAPHLSVFRRTATGAEEMASGARAGRGDVLQVSYVAGDAKYGVILSVDGRGTVTWHLPPAYAGGARTAAALEPQGRVVLPSAYELDDAPGFERFFFVYSADPFDVGEVDRAARALAGRATSAERNPLGLPRSLGQFSLLVKKQG